MAQNAAVEKLKNKVVQAKPVDMATVVRNSIEQFGNALPSFISPERFVRAAVTAMRTNPKLAQCTQASLLGALFQSAQLGLEPNVEGQAYIIPYLNSKKVTENGKIKWIKVMEAQFQIGYKGYIELFYRHGSALTIDVHTVYENDLFEYTYGTQQYLKHCPVITNRGDSIAYYAAATLKNGGSLFKVMSKEECIEHGKKYSKCYVTSKYDKETNSYVSVTPHFEENSPWDKELNAMCKKTVLIQLAKLLPKSVELQKAIAMDCTTKSIDPSIDSTNMFEIPDETNWDDDLSKYSLLPSQGG